MTKYQLYEDQLLSDLLSKGDKIAFTEIYGRYWKKLFGIAYNRLREMETAEDLVHDIFASLWTNREKIKIETLDNYLATAVKYLVLVKIKRKERERLYNNASSTVQVVEMPFENPLHYKQILERVKNEAEKLPEKCKLIFIYSRFEDMPAKQIANELGISPKTVANQLHKAIKQLKLVTKAFIHLLLLLHFISL